MNFAWLFGLICLSAVSVISQSDMFQLVKREEGNRKFCGNFLAEILSRLCRGTYNGYSTKAKKDGSWIDMTSDDYDLPSMNTEFDWPLISHQAAATFMNGEAPQYRRYRRGVYDECCKKPCSMNVLRTYCAT